MRTLPYVLLVLAECVLLLTIVQSRISAKSDDSDNANSAARDDATHAAPEEDEGVAPPRNYAPLASLVALDPDEQPEQVVVASALSEAVTPPPPSDATLATAQHLELSLTGDCDDYLNDPSVRSALASTSSVNDDPHSVLSPLTAAHAPEGDPTKRDGTQPSTMDSQTTSPDETTTALSSSHRLNASPLEIGPEPSTLLSTNVRSAPRGVQDPGTHHPPTTSLALLQFVGSATGERAMARTEAEAAQAATDVSTSPCPRTAEQPAHDMPPSVHQPMTGSELRSRASQVALEIDGRERDLEAGPPIPSPTSDDSRPV